MPKETLISSLMMTSSYQSSPSLKTPFKIHKEDQNWMQLPHLALAEAKEVKKYLPKK